MKESHYFCPTNMDRPQKEQAAYFKRLAAGGCAMIIVGDVPVLLGRFSPFLYSMKGFAYYKALAEAVHSEGGKICGQLHKFDANLKDMLKYIPGILTKRISIEELRPLLNQQIGLYITGMPVEKIHRITEAFGTATEFAMKAGFDVVHQIKKIRDFFLWEKGSVFSFSWAN